MEHNFPCPIVSEKDLKYYDEYIKTSDVKPEKSCAASGNRSDGVTILPPTDSLHDFLKMQIGKIVRIESLVGSCLERRVGQLMQVGADYIVIKLYQSCSTTICELSSVKYITVIHDNDLNKAVF